MKQLIFYGAGRYAQRNLDECIKNGLTPVCFVDSDKRKHYTKLGGGYDILPLNKAMEMYPDATLCITARNYWVDIYDYIKNQGIPSSRIASIVNNKLVKDAQYPQYCHLIGHDLMLDGSGISTCCKIGYRTTIASDGNIKKDIIKYNEFVNRLRDDLTQGKLTGCTGCPELRDGIESEKMSVKHVIIGTALPGHQSCNFKCSYCTYELEVKKVWDSRTDSVVDIFQEIESISSIDTISYISGEISVSPFKYEIINIWNKNGWGGWINTNASIYIYEMAKLASKYNIILVISLDAGTKETFNKIKGVDCFEKVIENIKKYSIHGVPICLKYVLLENINGDEHNLFSFVRIAKEMNANVQIVRDFKNMKIISQYEHSAMIKLTNKCLEMGVPVNFNDHCTS